MKIDLVSAGASRQQAAFASLDSCSALTLRQGYAVERLPPNDACLLRRSDESQPGPCRRDDFTATNWTEVRLAGEQDASAQAQLALESLCARYWPATYAFLRRQNYSPADAEDLTQGFFAHLLAGNALARVNPAKGRFRNFLLGALRRYLVDALRQRGAQKRGYRQVVLALDFRAVEEAYLDEADPGLTPQQQYDRRWATTVLEAAFADLQAEFRAIGQTVRFDELKRFLAEEGVAVDYEAVGARLGLKPKAVSSAASRLRERYRELVLQNVAATVGRADQVAPEFTDLFR